MTGRDLADLVDWWRERAAIFEADGEMTRADAETMASARLAETVPLSVVRAVEAMARRESQ